MTVLVILCSIWGGGGGGGGVTVSVCRGRGGHLGANEPTVSLKCFFFGSEEAP